MSDKLLQAAQAVCELGCYGKLLTQIEQLERNTQSSNESAYQRGYMDGRAVQSAKPLTDGAIAQRYSTATGQSLRESDQKLVLAFARAIEAAHGVKE
jgi:hypothetical protein